MTGVIVRSGANVEAGAVTRASAIMHGVWLLLFVSALPFTLKYIPLSALAAILVFTGYKLAYPKIVPTLLKYGRGEVVIYFVTIIMIVTTNLLEGVLVGLGLSLIKLLYAFSHLDVRKVENGADNRVDLYLKGSATLIRLPKLAAELEKLKPGANVHVHIEELDYIDHACLDLLSNWDRQHAATGGSLTIEWDELSNKYHQRRSSNMKAARQALPPRRLSGRLHVDVMPAGGTTQARIRYGVALDRAAPVSLSSRSNRALLSWRGSALQRRWSCRAGRVTARRTR